MVKQFCIHYHFFFHQSYPTHHDLHSFPTRRSSDLYLATLLIIGSLMRLVGGTARAVRPRSTGANSSRRAADEADRKSTRLNSSHVEISYAVFCLKKKNIRQNLLL